MLCTMALNRKRRRYVKTDEDGKTELGVNDLALKGEAFKGD